MSYIIQESSCWSIPLTVLVETLLSFTTPTPTAETLAYHRPLLPLYDPLVYLYGYLKKLKELSGTASLMPCEQKFEWYLTTVISQNCMYQLLFWSTSFCVFKNVLHFLPYTIMYFYALLKPSSVLVCPRHRKPNSDSRCLQQSKGLLQGAKQGSRRWISDLLQLGLWVGGF